MDQGNELLRQATEALGQNHFDEALSLAESVIGQEPTSADGWVMKGIALAQLGRGQEANTAFQAAIAHNPTNSKAYYNFATHLYQQGLKSQAAEYAKQALAHDPNHASARDLVQLVESESAAIIPPPSPEAGMPYSTPNTFSSYQREGYQTPTQTIPFIAKLGATWTVIGWCLSLVGIVFFFYQIIHVMPYFDQIMTAMTKNQGIEPIVEKIQKESSIWTSVLDMLLRFGTVLYAVLDLVNRRGNFVWLVAFIPCSCMGMQWMILPLYLLLGRRGA